MHSMGRSQTIQPSVPVTDSVDVRSVLAGLRLRLRKQSEVRETAERPAFATSATATVVAAFWDTVRDRSGCTDPLRLPPIAVPEVADDALPLYGRLAAALPQQRAFFEIGELYTALLPADLRTRLGIYYTPPSLVERLLDVLEREGIDWKSARVLDPACGGAAFAAFVAERMLRANGRLPAEARLRELESRLVGFEIDPFAAWLAAVFLDVVCLPLVQECGYRLNGIIRPGDALAQPELDFGCFDLVVGNPPYGKVQLSPAQRNRFRRSLFGHANVYGVFADLAVRLTRPAGLVGLVTPTSFLGGEYFKNLRQVLRGEAPIVHATFLADREGVFSDVLQETMLVVLRKRSAKTNRRAARGTPAVRVEVMRPHRGTDAGIEPLGRIELFKETAGPWVLPRDSEQAALIERLGRLPARLADYGYRVATGQLVWNRHKAQFRERPGMNRYPVLWAECIGSDGSFEFRAESRNHLPFIELESGQDFLINCEPCVLIQRTTSKEQARRLIAAVIPNEFVVEQPGFVVENHVNMLMRTAPETWCSLALLARLFNSQIFDQAFRCISGSVAVSAYELGSLPMPDPDDLFAWLRRRRVTERSRDFDERLAEYFYDAPGL